MKHWKNIGGVTLPRALCLVLTSALLLVVTGLKAQAQFMPTRHVRPEIINGRAPMLNRLPPNQSMRLNITLPLRNEPELDELLRDLYNPESVLYHQFLSVQEFTERFGPTEEDYAEVIRFARRNRLRVTGTFGNRMVLNVEGSVANVERAFEVQMATYQHPTENRIFYGPDREPTPDLAVPLWHISGLDNFSIPHPVSLRRDQASKGNTTGSGPGGYFLGSDMRAAYYGGTSLNGSGQSVGLLEFAGYNVADVQTYFNKVGQPLNVAVTGVSTDRSSLSCTGRCDDTEQVLDMEVAISMAPGLSNLLVYVSDTSDVSIFNRMATDNIAKSLSCSWGWSPADPASDDPIFKEFAAQGQNLFVASGDSGAYKSKSKYVFPADDPYVTSVGGTDLTTNGPGGSWKSETAWSGQRRGYIAKRHRDSFLPEDERSHYSRQQRLAYISELSRRCSRGEYGQLHLLRRHLRGRMGWNQFRRAPLGGLSGVDESTSRPIRKEDTRLCQPSDLYDWPRVELLDRSPRHYKREQRHLLVRKGFRLSNWMG